MSTKQDPKPSTPTPTPTQTPTPPAAAAPARPVGTLDQLDALLRELIAEHETLLKVTVEHRNALATANLSALSTCIKKQNEIVQRIAAIERRRAALVQAIQTERAAPRPAEPITVAAIAGAAPEPARSRLLGLGGTLKDLLNRLHREHVSLKLAAETLAAHVDGVMRQVCRQLSHTGTYARSGMVDSSVRVVSSLDVHT